MSANLEWTIPFTIQSTRGDLTLNDEANALGLYLLMQEGCTAMRQLRIVTDDIPQADGQINHQRFTAGYTMQLLVGLWESRTKPACDEQARLMGEALMLHLNTMLNDSGRLFWTPTGLGDQRLLDECQTRDVGAFGFGPAFEPRLQFTFDSPFPYVYDFAQETTVLEDGVPEVVNNEGNVDFWPVVKVYGSASLFTLQNVTLNQAVIYDDSLPGAPTIGPGDYMEFDFFRNTAFLNGTGADGMPGVYMELSDFWPIQGGVSNTLQIDNAPSADVLWNHSYA